MGIPVEEVIHFEDGLVSYLQDELHGKLTVTEEFFHGEADLPDKMGKVEWSMAWPVDGEGFMKPIATRFIRRWAARMKPG